MQITCTGCRNKLQIPDDAAGKQVRCPLCQRVFAAPILMEIDPGMPVAKPIPPATAVTTSPPPLPPVNEPGAAPKANPPDKGPEREDEFDDEDQRDERAGRDRTRQRELLRSGAIWLTASGIYFIVNVLFNIFALIFILPGQPFRGQGGQDPAYMIGIVCGMSFFCIPTIFMLVGASQMRPGGSRGLVITGVVFDFIMCAFMLLGMMCNFAGLAGGLGRIVVVAFIQIIMGGGGITLGLIAGIKTLNLLGRPEVQAAFGIRTHRGRDWDDDNADGEWERKRRLRRRHGGEE